MHHEGSLLSLTYGRVFSHFSPVLVLPMGSELYMAYCDISRVDIPTVLVQMVGCSLMCHNSECFGRRII